LFRTLTHFEIYDVNLNVKTGLYIVTLNNIKFFLDNLNRIFKKHEANLSNDVFYLLLTIIQNNSHKIMTRTNKDKRKIQCSFDKREKD